MAQLPHSYVSINECPVSITDTCRGMLSQRYSVIKPGKQPSCLSAEEWVKRQWYISQWKFFQSLKKTGVMSCTGKWTQLEEL